VPHTGSTPTGKGVFRSDLDLFDITDSAAHMGFFAIYLLCSYFRSVHCRGVLVCASGWRVSLGVSGDL
jgi:hypothetical protein